MPELVQPTATPPARWAPDSPWPDGATNPVMRGFHPDPTVCRVDGPDGTWYHLVTSTFEYLPGLPVFRSRDLIGWELLGHVLDRDEQVDLLGVRDSGGLYAPTLRHDVRRGVFLLVCTVVGGVEGASGNFVCTATDPAGPWSDPVWWDTDGIDPSVLVDDDGRWWAHGTRLVAQPQWDQQTEVWVRELDPQTLRLTGPEHVVWTGALIGAIWAEGPHLYRRDGHVYLLAAEGGTGRDHAVSVARAEHPTGPFVGNPRNPVLTHRHLGSGSSVVNVGHADLVDAPDGSSWALLLASRPVDGADLLGRETFLVPVTWEDGWPVLAPGFGHLVPEPGGPTPSGAPATTSPEEWVAVRRQPARVGSAGDDGRVTLAAGEGLSGVTPAFLAQRVRDLTTPVEVVLEHVPPGVEAGLGLRYSTASWVAVLTDGGAVRVLSARDGAVEEIARVVVDVEVRSVALQLAGARAVASWTDSEGSGHPVVDVDLAHLCAEASGGFVGITAGVLAVVGNAGEGGVVAARFRTGGLTTA
ncbi:glycoside hydrolase family 43 protein [Miniimonas sp. S16]|uniref:glycoside hydrolase family 43 protein n=1 Tax=Miniimonas sp. S16 TaxID=2171623 RepID=UPI000D52689B|nr:glycoside hydrolase family 43 protein [Miniimonas sp. S16]